MLKAKLSFTAADSIPAKLLQNTLLIEQMTQSGLITPYHIQFIPTNRCNLKCDFCSCSKDDRKTEMPYNDAQEIIEKFAFLGTKAATVTGGGEPLLHPYIENILDIFNYYKIKTGLVTNGLLLKRFISSNILSTLTWCRISHGDFRDFTDDYEFSLMKVIQKSPNVDWAFSYVVGPNPRIRNISKIISFANLMNFSHIRLVADLFQPNNVDMKIIGEKLSYEIENSGVPVILQPRKEPTKGGDCHIAFLKPLIGADQKIYACCGVQYALKEPSKSLPEELCLGNAKDIAKIILRSKKPFDGSICERCYYSSYNNTISLIKSKLDHQEFI